MKVDIVYDIPVWAANYIMYNDTEGLSGEDRKQVNVFILSLKKQGIVRFIEPADCSEQVFNKYPAFGEACGTQDWIVEVDNGYHFQMEEA